ncbi:hypothetical protein ZWY2020_025360 [Hordeum vulgare]|nr:hypothetical protein ZWY2020_025360 [Hordeum vulgare]
MGCLLPPPPMRPHHKTTMGGGPVYHAAALPKTFPVFASYPPRPCHSFPLSHQYVAFLSHRSRHCEAYFHFAPPSLLRLTTPQRRLDKVALSAAPPHAADETFPGKDVLSCPLPAAAVSLSTEVVPLPPAPTTPVPSSRTALEVSAAGLLRRLMFWVVDVDTKKKQAQAAAVTGQAQPVKPHGRKVGSRLMQARHRDMGRRSRELWRQHAKAAPTEVACKPSALSSTFTMRPPMPRPAPEWRNPRVTTVMIRNIPNRLKPAKMMQLLDNHCARANREEKTDGDVPALYLPMDFSTHGRVGFLQGKKVLVKHFSNSTFLCATDDFLPAVFSPPRDGVLAGEATATATRVGTRVTPPATPRAHRLAGKPAVRGPWASPALGREAEPATSRV